MARKETKREAKARRADNEVLFEQYIGSGRTFAGTIEKDQDAARLDDEERWKDVRKICPEGNALVYWTDGSVKKNGMGASVVLPQAGNPGRWSYRGFHILSTNKGSHSAETFAVAAALGIATEKVKEHANIKLVRIYTDCLSLLEQLTLGSGRNPGPKLSNKYALQVIYEQTEWLEDQGVRGNLVWVKAHHQSEGNEVADKIAGYAASSKYEEFSGEDFDLYSRMPITPNHQARLITSDDETDSESESTLKYQDMWDVIREEASRRKGKGWVDKDLYYEILDLEVELDEQEIEVDNLLKELDGLDDELDDQEERRRSLTKQLNDAEDREQDTYEALKSKLKKQLEEWNHPMVAR